MDAQRAYRRVSSTFGIAVLVFSTMVGTLVVAETALKRASVEWTSALVVAGIAAVGVVVLRAVRKVASARYVDASVRRGRVGFSPAFPLTLAAWLLTAVGFGAVAGTAVVDSALDEAKSRASLQAYADFPDPILFLFAGLVLLAAAGYYSWRFRERHEVLQLEAAGIVVLNEPEPPRPIKATRLWLVGTLVDALLFAGAIVPRLFTDNDRPTSDELLTGGFGVLAGPAVVSFSILLLMMANWSTRRSAWRAVSRPTSLGAIALVLIGVALDRGAGLEVVGAVVGCSGILLGSITCLNIMTRGAQPWMGLLYLAGNYVYGYLTAPNGDYALPQGITGWIIAILAAAFAIREAYKHYREWTELTPPGFAPAPPY
ncbi:hypothetical protein VSH64_48375 [Amycolatopsis rhabdoformis]|uniref:Uncharacterized protein n=1 Tax=Amycolatopsis rhabdoformis TaxID=1448059 RepID=A0ABZ1I7W6_9PSEU|nr:hypothetical protein [Amycolatopsis rhabdoformis]WSE30524.1 hypothetical protein VSH64_48375 [Amycolatopsis rhabdoformis]